MNAEVKHHFEVLCEQIFLELQADEQATLQLSGEDSLYIRFNNTHVRQNTYVQQLVVMFKLQKNQRTVEHSFCLSANASTDLKKLREGLLEARRELAQLPPDPHQVALVSSGSSDHDFGGTWPETEALLEEITTSAKDCDLSGLLCCGSIVRAIRNSLGLRHWFAARSFFLDFSIYDGHVAAKGSYADKNWCSEAWKTHLQEAKNQLSLLKRPLKVMPPGTYRTYLAPAAVAEVVAILGYRALSFSAHRQGRNPLRGLADGERQFSPLLSLRENFDLGLNTQFNDSGELAPAKLDLITSGRFANFLTSSRSSREYGVPTNAAKESESPRSLEILPGNLKRNQILKELGTGLYLSNLHYLNWSDLVSARITGMTRYACFWVENGEIVGPIKDLRFDVSLYDVLAEGLVAVTDFQEISPSTETYEQRNLGGCSVPGLLIEDFKFTL